MRTMSNAFWGPDDNTIHLTRKPSWGEVVRALLAQGGVPIDLERGGMQRASANATLCFYPTSLAYLDTAATRVFEGELRGTYGVRKQTLECVMRIEFLFQGDEPVSTTVYAWQYPKD